MDASLLGVSVVPVRIDGLEHVLRRRLAHGAAGRVRVAFGARFASSATTTRAGETRRRRRERYER